MKIIIMITRTHMIISFVVLRKYKKLTPRESPFYFVSTKRVTFRIRPQNVNFLNSHYKFEEFH